MKNFRYIDGAAILELNEKVCIGCGLCAIVCPHRIFEVQSRKARIIDHDGCMECGACATNCPVEAIFVNPDNGCGCASMIINTWVSKIRGKPVNICGC